MKVSVLIPVYNAGPYLEECVQSALDQAETAEVILVEDGSNDNSLEVCRKMVGQDDRVKLYQHEGGVNRGPGVTRNVAMEKATQEWIAFLDADDIFCQDRFRAERELINKHPDLDGTYGATGVIYEEGMNEAILKKWDIDPFTTMSTEVPPRRLLPALLGIDKDFKNAGYFSIITLFFHRRVIDEGKVRFPEDMYYHQDTFFIFAVAALYNLYPGDLKEAVSLRRVHPQNRITQKKNVAHTKSVMFAEFAKWCKSTPGVAPNFANAANNLSVYHRLRDLDFKSKKALFLKSVLQSSGFATNPKFFNSGMNMAFGENSFSKFVISMKELIQFKILRRKAG